MGKYEKLNYRKDITLQNHIKQIVELITLPQKCKILRISGQSGLGKTRLVYEAVKETQACNKLTCFYGKAEDINVITLVSNLLKLSESVLLIIDNCPKEVHDELIEKVSSPYIKLITIGYESIINTLTEQSIQLLPTTKEVIEEIIRPTKGYEELNAADINKISELSCGYPKFAELIADAYIMTSDLRNINKFTVLDKVLWNNIPYDKQAYEIVQSFALFEEVGIKDGYKHQYELVSNKICKLSPYEAYALASRKFKNRGIFIEYGRFAKIEPKPLALMLAAEWWQERHIDEIKEIFELICQDIFLLKSFFKRFSQLDFLTINKEFFDYLENYLNRIDIIESETGYVIIENLTHIAPHLVIKVIDDFFSHNEVKKILCAKYQFEKLIKELIEHGEKIANQSSKKIYTSKFSDVFFSSPIYSSHAESLINLLTEIAKEKKHFIYAGKVLLKLTLENNQQYSHIAKRAILELFDIISSTLVPLGERFLLLDTLQNSDSYESNKLIIDILNKAFIHPCYTSLEQNYTKGSSRPKKSFFTQKITILEGEQTYLNYKIVKEYTNEAISRLSKFYLLDTTVGVYTRKLLARHISSLVEYGHIDELSKIVKQIGEKFGFWHQGLIEILKNLIKYSKYSTFDNSLTSQLETLAIQIIPKNIYTFLEFCIHVDFVIYIKEKEIDHIFSDFTLLVKLVVSNNTTANEGRYNFFELLLKRLPYCVPYIDIIDYLIKLGLANLREHSFDGNLLVFAPRLIYKLYKSMLNYLIENNKVNEFLNNLLPYCLKDNVFWFVSYFIRNLSKEYLEEVSCFLNSLAGLGNKEKFILSLTINMRCSDTDIERIFDYIQQNKLSNVDLEKFRYCEHIDLISRDKIADIINRIKLSKSNHNQQACIDILARCFTLHDNLFLCDYQTFLLEYKITEETNEINLGKWVRRCKILTDDMKSNDFVGKLVSKIYEILKINKQLFALTKDLIESLFKNHSMIAWSYFKKLFTNEYIQGMHNVQIDKILEKISLTELIHWCKENVENSILLAKNANLFDVSEKKYKWNGLAKHLINNYWSEKLREALDLNIYNELHSIACSIDGLINIKKIEISLFRDVIDELNKEATEWANLHLILIKENIKRLNFDIEENAFTRDKYVSIINELEFSLSKIGQLSEQNNKKECLFKSSVSQSKQEVNLNNIMRSEKKSHTANITRDESANILESGIIKLKNNLNVTNNIISNHSVLGINVKENSVDFSSAKLISTYSPIFQNQEDQENEGNLEQNKKFVELRKGLENEIALKSLLNTNLSGNLLLGKSIDNGDCFFDSLAQILNKINETDVNTVKYLRMLCHDFYSKNREIVAGWNKKDYGGIDNKKDEYYMVQYTYEECEQDFNGRSPIWGRPGIEGVILCKELQLAGILVIEILEDPETKQPIISYHLATTTDYKSISEKAAQQYLNNPKIPTLVVEQNSLHFVPLFRNNLEHNNEQQIVREKTQDISKSYTFSKR